MVADANDKGTSSSPYFITFFQVCSIVNTTPYIHNEQLYFFSISFRLRNFKLILTTLLVQTETHFKYFR
jgi:hypothetical protein